MGANKKQEITLRDFFYEDEYTPHISVCPFSTNTEDNVPRMILDSSVGKYFIGDIITTSNSRYEPYEVHKIGTRHGNGYTYDKPIYYSDGTLWYTNHDCQFSVGQHILPILNLDAQKLADFMENNSSGFEIVSAYNKRPCLKLGKLTMPILNWTSVSSSINPMASGNDNFITVALPGNVFNTPIEIKLKGYYSIYPSFDDSTRIESQDSIKILLDAFEESCSLFSTPIKHTPKATKEPEVARLIKLLKINDTYKDLYLIQPLKDRVGDLEKRMNGAERTTERNRQELQETILRIQEETASQIQDLADLHNPPLQLRRTLEAIKHMSSDKYLY